MPKELGDYLLKLDLMHKLNIMIKSDIRNNTEIKDLVHVFVDDKAVGVKAAWQLGMPTLASMIRKF